MDTLKRNLFLSALLIVGLKPHLIAVFFILSILLIYAYRYLHILRWQITKPMLLIYGSVIVFACQLLEKTTHVHLEILMPTFLLGCLL